MSFIWAFHSFFLETMGGWEICIQQCNRPSLVLSLEPLHCNALYEVGWLVTFNFMLSWTMKWTCTLPLCIGAKNLSRWPVFVVSWNRHICWRGDSDTFVLKYYFNMLAQRLTDCLDVNQLTMSVCSKEYISKVLWAATEAVHVHFKIPSSTEDFSTLFAVWAGSRRV